MYGTAPHSHWISGDVIIIITLTAVMSLSGITLQKYQARGSISR